MTNCIIYLDNAATTKPNSEVLSTMANADNLLFYNSAALYEASLNVKRELSNARQIITKKLTHNTDGELIITSGATESNNMVLLGKITHKNHHLLILSGEHSSSYGPAMYLRNQGFDVDFVPLKNTGEADLDAIKRLVKPSTALFAFGMVNSDTGTLHNSEAIVKLVRSLNKQVHIHCDATQAFCKFDFDVHDLGFDSVSISAHKIHGPKGIGGLWIKKGTKLNPIMIGGSQQNYRPGTESNASILGFAKAVEIFKTAENFTHVQSLKKYLLANLPEGCRINGEKINPYITNIQLPNVLGQTVMNALSSQGICVGLGSACSSTASKNRTLLAMGISESKTKQVIRVSFSATSTLADVDTFCALLKNILDNLR